MVVDSLLDLQYARMTAVEAQFASDLKMLEEDFETCAPRWQLRCSLRSVIRAAFIAALLPAAPLSALSDIVVCVACDAIPAEIARMVVLAQT